MMSLSQPDDVPLECLGSRFYRVFSGGKLFEGASFGSIFETPRNAEVRTFVQFFGRGTEEGDDPPAVDHDFELHMCAG